MLYKSSVAIIQRTEEMPLEMLSDFDTMLLISLAAIGFL